MPSATAIDLDRVDACMAVVRQSAAPMTAAEIGAACLGKKPTAKFNATLVAELSRLPAESGVHEWPKNGRSRIFCGRSFRVCVEEALLQALAEQPLTVAQAAKPVAKILRRASQAAALKEIKAAAPALVSANRILAFAINRQSVVYFSFAWLERLLPARPSASALSEAIREGVLQLQSGAGNYVRVDRLRNTSAIRRAVDRAAIELADAGKLILTRYDGPKPVPDTEKTNYIEDAGGDLFIGVALPRSEEAGA